MGAGFEVDVESAAAGASGSFFQSEDFGMLYAVIGVSAFAGFLSGGIHDHGRPHHGIGRSQSDAGIGPVRELCAGGRVRRSRSLPVPRTSPVLQVLSSQTGYWILGTGPFHANSESTNSFASNGSRSPAFSPTPTNRTGNPSSREIATTTPPLAVPSSLVRTIPVTPADCVNWRACCKPFWPVVASITSKVSWGAPGTMRCGGAFHFFQFHHQVLLVVQAAGGVDDDVVGLAGGGGLQGVEQDGCGIASGFGLDHLGAGALSPDFELLDGGGAESVGGAEQNGLALRAEDLR